MRRIARTPRCSFTGLITAALSAVFVCGALAAGAKPQAIKPLAATGTAADKPTTQTPAQPASAPQSPLAREIDRLVKNPALARMRIGVRVESLGPQSGLVYEYNSREPLVPASNQKLIASAAAMCMLPADFKYRTVLGGLGQDLVVLGAGDPVFGDPRLAKRDDRTITAVFHDWAARLKAAGIQRVDGDLIFDDFVFDQQHMHPKWPSMFNLQSWYTAPISGLNFNDNCVDVVVKRGPANGAPAEVILIPNTPYCAVSNKAVTATKGQPLVHRSGEDPVTINVSGSVSRSGSAESPLSIPIVDPGMFFAGTLRTVLASQGIEITGKTRRQRIRQVDGMISSKFQVLAIHEQTLPDILERMNTNSLNMCAEAMLKTLGAYSTEGKLVQQGTLETGRATVAKFLRSLGISDDLYAEDDGSGLSRDNRAAAVVYTAILKRMDAHSQREIWWKSLAEAGHPDGSLKRRMKDLGGKVFGKTGHINNVSTLSGYVSGPGSRRYAFSVLCNDTYRAKGGTSSAHTLQDNLCRLLATWNQ